MKEPFTDQPELMNFTLFFLPYFQALEGHRDDTMPADLASAAHALQLLSRRWRKQDLMSQRLHRRRIDRLACHLRTHPPNALIMRILLCEIRHNLFEPFLPILLVLQLPLLRRLLLLFGFLQRHGCRASSRQKGD